MALLIYNNGIVTPTTSVLKNPWQIDELASSSRNRQTEAEANLTRALVPLGQKKQHHKSPSNLYIDTQKRSDSLQERRKLQALHIMSSPVITLPPEGTIYRALALLDDNEVDHLIVVDEDFCPLSLLTRAEILKAHSEEELFIRPIMSEILCAITSDTLVRDIAQFFVAHKMSAMPVVEQKNNTLLGIICRPDLLRLLVSGPNIEHEI